MTPLGQPRVWRQIKDEVQPNHCALRRIFFETQIGNLEVSDLP